ncbi:MAG: DUF1738 domain-containing protein [Ignavibacteria bacterium]|nr:DUF1738 domain-containing protein [Ignavibacteria bacterium]
MKRKELFEYIINSIKANFEKGTIPWRKPWKVGVPMNFITRRPYNGINYILLSLTSFPSPYFLTYLQCQNLNGKVLKNSKGFPIVYWKHHEVDYFDDETNQEQTKVVSIYKVSYVFNISQTTLYKEQYDTGNKILDCEYVINRLEPELVIKNNFQRCFYDPVDDYISIPPVSYFSTPEEYYASLFHELIHWTGHPSRLNRLSCETRIPSPQERAIEEMVAEIGSSFLCGLCGIAPKTLDNQSAYISNWLKLAEDDPNALINSISLARQAVDYLVPESVYNYMDYIKSSDIS